jgi:glycosyltransferase involved in cell wall biosynthesis
VYSKICRTRRDYRKKTRLSALKIFNTCPEVEKTPKKITIKCWISEIMPVKKIAYIASRFPVLTETFITREVEELRHKGIDVEVFSLKGPNLTETSQSNTKELIETTHYYPYFFSFRVWKALIYFFITRPASSFEISATIITTHISNPLRLLKTIAIIPKSFAIAKTLKEMGITRVHAHWATIPTTAAWIIAKLNDCTYTFTAHAWDIYQVDTMLKDKLRDAATIITISDYNKRYLTDKFPDIDPEKIKVVHCGLDFKQFTLQNPDKGDVFKILSIGRLTEKKGFHVLLKACKTLKDIGIPFLCQIVYVRGDYEREIFQLYDHLKLEGCVQFIPELPQKDIIKYYSGADCFALPCVIAGSKDRDGIPVVILEAMAMQLPVVSTPVSGIPEVVKNEETGLLANPGDADDLAQAINRLYADPELREKLGVAGRNFVTQQFEISSTVDQLAENIL